jgi:hypothetical protein
MRSAIVGAVLGCSCVLFGWFILHGLRMWGPVWPLVAFVESHMLLLIPWLSTLGAVLGGTRAVIGRIEDLGHFTRRRVDIVEGSRPSAKPENNADDGPA